MEAGLQAPAGMCPVAVLSTWDCTTKKSGGVGGGGDEAGLLSLVTTNPCHLQLGSEPATFLLALGQPL